MPRIHPSAIVDAKAELAEDVEVGPFSIVGPSVSIGAGTRIGSHTVIAGRTTIGRANHIFSFCALGTQPQDKKYAGEDTELVIGDGNTVREYCLLNTGTVQGGGVTCVGSDNWIMAYTHLAHDCILGDHTIIANGVQLAGHVRVDDWAVIGGTAAVHQFVRIGAHTMVGGGTILVQDVPPFTVCTGHPAQPHGIHVEGLRRRRFSPETIAVLKRAYRTLYRENLPLAEAVTALEAQIGALAPAEAEAAAPLRALVDFLAVPGRGIVR
jgi:UDP-N-acetylglucosamine acyltransferase